MLSEEEFVKFVNLPPLPGWYIKSARDLILANDNSSPSAYVNDPIVNLAKPAETVEINNKIFHYGNFFRQKLGNIHHQWAAKHLPNIPDLNVVLVNKGDLWPHQDYQCAWSLIWVVDAGGDDVETYWSKPKDGLLRPEYQDLLYWRYYTGLEEIHSECIPVGKWAIIPVNVVHGTKNQTGDRIIITTKITQQQYEEIIKDYS